MLHPLDLMEPEETVGGLWHDWASRQGAAPRHPAAAVAFEQVRPSAAALFRALGGPEGTEIAAAPAAGLDHRLSPLRRLGVAREQAHVADYDGARLRLPPVMDLFPDRALNRAAYLWLAAMAAGARIPAPDPDPLRADLAEIAALAAAADLAWRRCPGLRAPLARLCAHVLAHRPRLALPRREAEVEARIRDQLDAPAEGAARPAPAALRAPRGYRPFAPVPIWPRLRAPAPGRAPKAEAEPGATPAVPTAIRKSARREDRDQASRRDSFIVHRFESIMSWAESLNLNRMTDDDDAETAQKAAEDQDHLTLSDHVRRAASRLRLSLDLSPQDAEHERLAGRFTYPEWDRKAGVHLPDHVRVLEAEAVSAGGFAPDPRLVASVRRRFAPLHPRRVRLPRQADGEELDLDAVVRARTELARGRAGDERLWCATRPMARDLSVAILMDCSRSTEAVAGDRPVIETAREALAALAAGIDSAGDRLAIWGFSSLRRDRVFLTRCKSFDEPFGPRISARIGALRPGHYTRLGAAIRHASAMLAAEGASRRLLLAITDGKPNDLDHYEGQHGIEDSRMAVREARAAGHAVHGVLIDPEGRDWFPRIFGRGGYALLPEPARLPRVLPRLYQSLTMEP